MVNGRKECKDKMQKADCECKKINGFCAVVWLREVKRTHRVSYVLRPVRVDSLKQQFCKETIVQKLLYEMGVRKRESTEESL